MGFEAELDIYLRARFSLIVLVTLEEERALWNLEQALERSSRRFLTWDMAEGFRSDSIVPGAGAPPAKDPITALEHVDTAEGDSVFVLKDFHDCWDHPQVKRKLRSVAQRLKFTKKSIVVTTPSANVPEELRDEAVIAELPPPGIPELDRVLTRLSKTPGVRDELRPGDRERLLRAALGLRVSQARRAFATAIVRDGVLDREDIELVNREKKQAVRENEALEFFAANETPSDVGGLETLKEWLRLRERAFCQEALDYGLPAPKGIALIGIPGTGKSLSAKMVAGLWRMPLLRLDVGALFGSLVGESEERARRTLRLAETVAPCVVWIDEMEKALSHGDLDSGTSTRVFGTILTWMQEKTAPCFVVATANDIAALPPELLRKGRFDEIFFLDLPTPTERRTIFEVHLAKRKRKPDLFDLNRLARESEGYVGSEIEQAIIDAMYFGFDAGREFETEDVSAALRRQVPLSVSQREIINALRSWLNEGRARSASKMETDSRDDRHAPLQLDYI
jgi:AAA+ superfamily predicted ATPase